MNQFPITKRVLVIVNPAAGAAEPILHPLNRLFRAREIDWDVVITHKKGDAAQFAKEAAVSGVDLIAIYGGDGTIGEVATGLYGHSDIPVALLPGGTANTLSRELGIPQGLEQAAALIGDPNSMIRQIDVGQVGERCFVLRLGIGIAADPVRLADQERKGRLGKLAYVLAAIEALRTAEVAQYQITIDGRQLEARGYGCQINNVTNMLIPDVGFPAGVVVDDGLLDLVLVGEVNIEYVRGRFGQADELEDEDGLWQMLPEIFQQWQGQEISIVTDPPHAIHLDGDIWGETPVIVRVRPKALSVLVPPIAT